MNIYFIAITGLLFGCQPSDDKDDLIGDSNVYGQPIEISMRSIDTENATVDLPSQLTAWTEGDSLSVEHSNLGLPCEHDVAFHIEAEWKQANEIFIDYHPEESGNSETCPSTLQYTLDVVEAGLTPGIYTVRCIADKTEIDLSDLLQ